MRSFLRLRMALDRLPDDPLAYAPPPGLEVRRFAADRDERATWATCQEAFAEHFRHFAQPLEEWLQSSFTEGVDTDLWFTAWDDDQMVGAVISYLEPYGGYVDQLAVRRPWRRRGLGRLLLLTAFAALRERGCAQAVLGVDSDNQTGAVDLYEQPGHARVGDPRLLREDPARRPLTTASRGRRARQPRQPGAAGAAAGYPARLLVKKVLRRRSPSGKLSRPAPIRRWRSP